MGRCSRQPYLAPWAAAPAEVGLAREAARGRPCWDSGRAGGHRTLSEGHWERMRRKGKGLCLRIQPSPTSCLELGDLAALRCSWGNLRSRSLKWRRPQEHPWGIREACLGSAGFRACGCLVMPKSEGNAVYRAVCLLGGELLSYI